MESATEFLHMKDSYLRAFDARVTAQNGQMVSLDRSAFYPGGGGQPADTGWLEWPGNRSALVEIKNVDGVSWHVLEGEVPAAGEDVHGVLDWERRYAIMRYHSGLHVLVGTVYHLFNAPVTGVAIYPDRARMDFALEEMNKDVAAAIENEANRVIQEGHRILVRWISREEFEKSNLLRLARNLVPNVPLIRVIDIEDFDAQADSGTHVASTLEIGRMVITKTDNKGKINRRIEIALIPPASSTPD